MKLLVRSALLIVVLALPGAAMQAAIAEEASATAIDIVPRTGNRYSVDDIAYASDGTRLVTGDFGKVRLWDAASGALLRTFEAHKSGIKALAFSPDGKRLMTGGGSSSSVPELIAKLWDTATGELLHTLEGHTGDVYAVAFSPDGKLLVTGSRDKTAKIWDATTGRLLRSLTGHANSVTAVAFSPDGRFALTGSSDRTLRLWDVASGMIIRTIAVGYEVWSMGLAPDGNRVITGNSTRVCLQRCDFKPPPWGLPGIDWPDPRVFRTDSQLSLWDLQTGDAIRIFGEEGKGTISSLAFLRNGSRVVSGGSSGIIVWDIAAGRSISSINSGPVNKIVLSPDNIHVLTKKDYGRPWAKAWDIASGTLVLHIERRASAITSVAIAPDGTSVMSGESESNNIFTRLWSSSTGRLERVLKGGGSAAFSPDSRRVLTAGSREMKLWDRGR